MAFLLKVFSGSERLKERQKSANNVNDTFQAELNNVQTKLEVENYELQMLVEMIYDSSYPESQKFLQQPTKDQLYAHKETISSLLFGLAAQGVSVAPLILTHFQKYGCDAISDTLVKLLELVRPLVASKGMPEFTSDDILDAIDVQWHSSVRSSPAFCSFRGSTGPSPLQSPRVSFSNVSPRQSISSPQSPYSVDRTLRSSPGPLPPFGLTSPRKTQSFRETSPPSALPDSGPERARAGPPRRSLSSQYPASVVGGSPSHGERLQPLAEHDEEANTGRGKFRKLDDLSSNVNAGKALFINIPARSSISFAVEDVNGGQSTGSAQVSDGHNSHRNQGAALEKCNESIEVLSEEISVGIVGNEDTVDVPTPQVAIETQLESDEKVQETKDSPPHNCGFCDYSMPTPYHENVTTTLADESLHVPDHSSSVGSCEHDVQKEITPAKNGDNECEILVTPGDAKGLEDNNVQSDIDKAEEDVGKFLMRTKDEERHEAVDGVGECGAVDGVEECVAVDCVEGDGAILDFVKGDGAVDCVEGDGAVAGVEECVAVDCVGGDGAVDCVEGDGAVLDFVRGDGAVDFVEGNGAVAGVEECGAALEGVEGCGEVDGVEECGAMEGVEGCGAVGCVEGGGAVAGVEVCGAADGVEGDGAVGVVEECGAVEGVEGDGAVDCLGDGAVDGVEGDVAVNGVEGGRAVDGVEECGAVDGVNGCGAVDGVEGCGAADVVEECGALDGVEECEAVDGVNGCGAVDCVEGCRALDCVKGDGAADVVEECGALDGVEESEAVNGVEECEAVDGVNGCGAVDGVEGVEECGALDGVEECGAVDDVEGCGALDCVEGDGAVDGVGELQDDRNASSMLIVASFVEDDNSSVAASVKDEEETYSSPVGSIRGYSGVQAEGEVEVLEQGLPHPSRIVETGTDISSESPSSDGDLHLSDSSSSGSSCTTDGDENKAHKGEGTGLNEHVRNTELEVEQGAELHSSSYISVIADWITGTGSETPPNATTLSPSPGASLPVSASPEHEDEFADASASEVVLSSEIDDLSQNLCSSVDTDAGVSAHHALDLEVAIKSSLAELKDRVVEGVGVLRSVILHVNEEGDSNHMSEDVKTEELKNISHSDPNLRVSGVEGETAPSPLQNELEVHLHIKDCESQSPQQLPIHCECNQEDACVSDPSSAPFSSGVVTHAWDCAEDGLPSKDSVPNESVSPHLGALSSDFGDSSFMEHKLTVSEHNEANVSDENYSQATHSGVEDNVVTIDSAKAGSEVSRSEDHLRHAEAEKHELLTFTSLEVEASADAGGEQDTEGFDLSDQCGLNSSDGKAVTRDEIGAATEHVSEIFQLISTISEDEPARSNKSHNLKEHAIPGTCSLNLSPSVDVEVHTNWLNDQVEEDHDSEQEKPSFNNCDGNAIHHVEQGHDGGKPDEDLVVHIVDKVEAEDSVEGQDFKQVLEGVYYSDIKESLQGVTGSEVPRHLLEHTHKLFDMTPPAPEDTHPLMGTAWAQFLADSTSYEKEEELPNKWTLPQESRAAHSVNDSDVGEGTELSHGVQTSQLADANLTCREAESEWEMNSNNEAQQVEKGYDTALNVKSEEPAIGGMKGPILHSLKRGNQVELVTGTRTESGVFLHKRTESEFFDSQSNFAPALTTPVTMASSTEVLQSGLERHSIRDAIVCTPESPDRSFRTHVNERQRRYGFLRVLRYSCCSAPSAL